MAPGGHLAFISGQSEYLPTKKDNICSTKKEFKYICRVKPIKHGK